VLPQKYKIGAQKNAEKLALKLKRYASKTIRSNKISLKKLHLIYKKEFS
jgi:hypothetical protein